MDPMDRLVSVAAATAPGTRRFVTVAAALFDDDDPAGALAALRSALDAWARTVDGTTETMPTGQRIARLTAQGVLPVSAAEHAQRILARTEATRSPSAADAADAADALARLITGSSAAASTSRGAPPPYPPSPRPQATLPALGAFFPAVLTAIGGLVAGVCIGRGDLASEPPRSATAPIAASVTAPEPDAPDVTTSGSPAAPPAPPSARAALLGAGAASERDAPPGMTPSWYTLPHDGSLLRSRPDPAATVVARLRRGASVLRLRQIYPDANPDYAYIPNDDIEHASDGRVREVGAFTVVKVLRHFDNQTSLVRYANDPSSAPIKVSDTKLVNFEAQSWVLVRTSQGAEGWIFGGLMPAEAFSEE
jgi:hypothetical protein